MSEPRPLRVLLVDDSATVRAVLRRILGRTVDITVAGEASDGAQAVEQTLALHPDVVLMDVEMPVVDGFAATERIMAVRPTPIVVISSRANRSVLHTAFEAIRRGAVEVFAKPEAPAGWDHLSEALPRTIRNVAGARARVSAPPTTSSGALPSPKLHRELRYVAIGASTGGPQAVHELLSVLPAEPPAAILVVQHIASGFDEGFADWLAKDLRRDVRLAADGESATPGTVRISPSGVHLRLDDGGALRLDAVTPARAGHRPSADELFLSCASTKPRQVAGVLLSGMGRDGAEGLAALRRAGGLTMVQDEASSVVFGMPKAALDLEAATITRPPRELGLLLAKCWQGECP
ncbi:MAG: chemotaxis-specific protein-glutamate methyltransferase CheB [Thermoanaerobaculaceae bacterium]|nr:chemotaxis-specific protein-glutamate methyltransferase CheB [Thermoanaerobaculaceae bacterium]MDI9620747.1 chemotaxis-specific protein-glutamate methyltransferase CheB [Acidobacteriota bacterium]NLH10791.1 chemotaxis-specific protein-glutamate methyltransferase CheB [Holophagae bacterium]